MLSGVSALSDRDTDAAVTATEQDADESCPSCCPWAAPRAGAKQLGRKPALGQTRDWLVLKRTEAISCSRETLVGGGRFGSAMQMRNMRLRRGLAGYGSVEGPACIGF